MLSGYQEGTNRKEKLRGFPFRLVKASSRGSGVEGGLSFSEGHLGAGSGHRRSRASCESARSGRGEGEGN